MDQIAWLAQELQRARSRVEEAQRDLMEAQERVKEIEIALKWLRRASGSVAETAEPGLPAGELADMSQSEAAAQVLRRAGRALPLNQVVDEMLAMGFQYDKKPETLAKSLRSTLSRLVAKKETFAKGGRGLYGLLEWQDKSRREAGEEPVREGAPA